MSEGWTVNSDQSRDAFIEHIKWRYQQKKFIRVELFDSARTLDQNRMTFELYSTIGRTLFGNDTEYARSDCKLRFGVPIMRRDSDKFRDVYDKVIRPHDHETKLKMMAILPVTSLMDRAQLSEYVEAVKNEYAKKGVDFSYLDQPNKRQGNI